MAKKTSNSKKKKPDSSKDISKALSLLGDKGFTGNTYPEVEVIPTEIEALNHVVLGCGGLPRGRVMEIYAPPSVGKSTLCYWFIGQVQEQGGVCALWDAEGTYSREYGASCGINNDELIMPDFSLGNEALFQVKKLLTTNMIDLMVVDAVPSLQPEMSSETKEDKDPNMREKLERANMLSQFFSDLSGGFTMRKAKGSKNWLECPVTGSRYHKLRNKKTCLIFVNHAKDKIGVMFGDPTTTPGGKGLKFASSIRIGMEESTTSKTKDDFGRPSYRVSRVKAAKNKLAPPFGTIKMKMLREGGVEIFGDDVEVEYDDSEDFDDIE